MAIFEAGILSKMTESEYEKLGKQQLKESENIAKNLDPSIKKTTRKIAKIVESNDKLKAINIEMLQGAFYLLLIGYFVAGKPLYFNISDSVRNIKVCLYKMLSSKTCGKMTESFIGMRIKHLNWGSLF